MPRLAALALILLLAVPAAASPVGDARALMESGDYAQAEAAAIAADSVDGLLLAAESKAARIMLMDTPDAKDTAEDALDLVERALKREPDNREALFLRALHQGFRTRSSSKFAIVMGGMIGDTQDDIEAFHAAAPDDARANALYGAWHLGIVRAAGDGKFGASLSDGMGHYDHAVAQRPDDIVVLSNYAFSLIVLDDPAVMDRARELLAQIETTEPTTAFARETKARMMRLKTVANDRDALRTAARDLLNTEES